ncbi:MAG: cytochrome c biogenesis protein CcsA [Nitrospirae bacterium]|nr:cytochrome c biogenesis protein CcsA [Nitrospirota bacterium]
MKSFRLTKMLLLTLTVLFPLCFYLIFQVAPTERIMGDVQRIFYLHIALAISAYLGFGVLFVSSIIYLIKKNPYWDCLASSAGEVGLLFATLVLITGSFWARPVWNVWWTWDPRLVSMLILWFIYVGYFMVRKAVSEKSRRARYSAIVGIIGFLDVPVVRLATKWWRSIHPRLDRQEGGLDPLMVKVMLVTLFTFIVFASIVIFIRFRISWAEERVNTIFNEMEVSHG